MRNDTNGFWYEEVPDDQMLKRLKDFDATLDGCARFWGLSRDAMGYNIPLMRNIYKRIDQRADYYLFFHSKQDDFMRMSQAKETSLLAFWIVKYKPIALPLAETQGLYLQSGSTVNELYAAYILASLAVEKSCRSDIETYVFQPEVLENMVYNLMNRDLSKEAIIFYVSSLLGKVEH
jgi:hypothetical protein